MNTSHLLPNSSDHITKYFMVVVIALTLSAVPAMSQTNTFPATGNVGIGTLSPQLPLIVNGSAWLNGTQQFGTGAWPTAAFGLGNGRAGFFNATEDGYLFFGNMQTGIGANRGGAILLGARNNTGVLDFTFSKIFGGRADAVEGSGWTYLAFSTSGAEAMRIDKVGWVGIGTTTPTAKLDVNGDVKVSGNIAAKYQDIAEWVSSERDMPSGTVVVLSDDQSNHVEESAAAYDTKVAGVVSERPGMILGEASAEKSKIATTGRVKVKVDATKHPVKIGDLLVTSGTPGYAMYSQPLDLGGTAIHRPGTILGKALEPLASGEGEILVLLSLQ